MRGGDEIVGADDERRGQRGERRQHLCSRVVGVQDDAAVARMRQVGKARLEIGDRIRVNGVVRSEGGRREGSRDAQRRVEDGRWRSDQRDQSAHLFARPRLSAVARSRPRAPVMAPEPESQALQFG